MKQFKSQQVSIQRPAEVVFSFVNDFNKLGMLMPEKVSNWQATAETCSFEIQGMAKLNMRVAERIESKLLVLKADGANPFDYKLTIHLFPANEMRCEVMVEFNAALNPMLSMMASKSLQKLVEQMVDQLKVELEK
jgi:carbon monoxide dehydrogenase subunit G